MNEISPHPAHIAYDRAFAARAPHLICRPERAEDRHFLIDLFIQNSPMRDVLPREMLVQQANLANDHFHAGHPDAMKCIFVGASGPVARFIINWSRQNHAHGVDLSVLPGTEGRGYGLAMLRAWLDVADTIGRPCRLEVLSTNPAYRIYCRLGFAPEDSPDPYSAVIYMTRPPRAPFTRP